MKSEAQRARGARGHFADGVASFGHADPYGTLPRLPLRLYHVADPPTKLRTGTEARAARWARRSGMSQRGQTPHRDRLGRRRSLSWVPRPPSCCHKSYPLGALAYSCHR